jgi:3-phytase
MRTIDTQSYTPRHDGGPARKLAAATRAVIEPVEARLMMSITPATEQVAAISAKYETTAVSHSGSAAEDPAVWVNPTDASASTIIGTDKQGALTVYSLDGKVIQTITGSGYNSVDVRGNLVAATNLSTNSINFFTVDPTTSKLSLASTRTIKPTIGGTIYGLTMYQSAESGKTYVFVTNRSGDVEQLEVTNTNGVYDAVSIRKFSVGSIAEGMVADDQTGALYVSQEDVALWKYGAEPTDGSVRTQVDKVGTGGHLVPDIEGLALYKTSDGHGYLIASSQGSDDYVVYDRETGEYVTRFNISGTANGVDGVSETAGIEATSVNLGGDFAGGAFIAQDTHNDGNENFKIVSWSSIANAQAVPLAIDSAQSAPVVTTPAPVTNLSAPIITSFNLVDEKTGEVLQTVNDGSVIDLSKYSGRTLNIEAIMSPTKGSVLYTLDGVEHLENNAPYRMVSDSSTWAPELGTHTITATTYNEQYAAGDVGNVYSFNITVVDNSSTTGGTTTTVTAPSTPTGLGLTVNGSDSISLDWASVSGATGYKIYRSTNGSTYTQVATATQSNFSDSNLADSTKYYYKVAAFNAAGSSSQTSSVSGTTEAAINTTPIDDIVTVVTGRPDAKNTGTTGSLQTVNSSSLSLKNGATFTNLIIKGNVDIRGYSNLTFSNCVFDAAGTKWCVRADDGAGTNRVFKQCEFKNMASSAIYGGDWSAINCYVHNSQGDGFKATQNVLIQGCYITNLGMSDGAHADGVQIRGGHDIKIVGNFFDMPILSTTSTNSSMFLQLDSKNVTFEGNWCVGGNYTVAAYPDTAPTSIKILNNTFYVGTPRYGFGNIFDGVVWSGNVTDTGKVATTNMK